MGRANADAELFRDGAPAPAFNGGLIKQITNSEALGRCLELLKALKDSIAERGFLTEIDKNTRKLPWPALRFWMAIDRLPNRVHDFLAVSVNGAERTDKERRTQGHVYIRSFLTHKEYDNPANWDRRFGTK